MTEALHQTLSPRDPSWEPRGSARCHDPLVVVGDLEPRGNSYVPVTLCSVLMNGRGATRSSDFVFLHALCPLSPDVPQAGRRPQE